MTRLLTLFLALSMLACAFVSTGSAEQIISSLSTGRVEIASNFDGSEIIIFGTIERDAATVARSGYDIVVTVNGPPEILVTRRKERVIGLWINKASRQFDQLPSFYAMMSNRPLDEITTERLVERYGIGMDQLPVHGARQGAATAEDQKFVDALFRLKTDSGLYRNEPDGVTFLSERLFRSTLAIPANVPVGTYEVNVHLFSGGALLATDTKPFQISKVGFERAMYALSQQQALVYGVATVIIAIFTGWLAGLIFRRD